MSGIDNGKSKKRFLIDELDTPTHKKIGAPLDVFLEGIDDKDHLTLKNCEELLTILSSYVSGEHKKTADDCFRWGLCQANELASKDDNSRLLVESTITSIAMGVTYLMNEVICKAIGNETKTYGNLLQNKGGIAKEEAQQQAAIFWESDTAQEYRITEASTVIRDHLEQSGFGLFTVGTVKKWIRDLSPDYASLPGKQKKSN